MSTKGVQFLDRWLGRLGRKPRVELLECAGTTLTWKVLSGRIRCGKQRVTLVTDDGERPSLILVTVAKTESCHGRWVDPSPEELAMSQEARIERRWRSRRPCQFRAVSPTLPGGSAFTEDIGSDGLRLLMGGSLTPGTKFDLALETDDSGLLPIKLRAEIRWCRPSERGHLAGVCLRESGKYRLEAVQSLGMRFRRRAEVEPSLPTGEARGR